MCSLQLASMRGTSIDLGFMFVLKLMLKLWAHLDISNVYFCIFLNWSQAHTRSQCPFCVFLQPFLQLMNVLLDMGQNDKNGRIYLEHQRLEWTNEESKNIETIKRSKMWNSIHTGNSFIIFCGSSGSTLALILKPEVQQLWCTKELTSPHLQSFLIHKDIVIVSGILFHKPVI